MGNQQFDNPAARFANRRLRGGEWWIKTFGTEFVEPVIMGDKGNILPEPEAHAPGDPLYTLRLG